MIASGGSTKVCKSLYKQLLQYASYGHFHFHPSFQVLLILSPISTTFFLLQNCITFFSSHLYCHLVEISFRKLSSFFGPEFCDLKHFQWRVAWASMRHKWIPWGLLICAWRITFDLRNRFKMFCDTKSCLSVSHWLYCEACDMSKSQCTSIKVNRPFFLVKKWNTRKAPECFWDALVVSTAPELVLHSMSYVIPQTSYTLQNS